MKTIIFLTAYFLICLSPSMVGQENKITNFSYQSQAVSIKYLNNHQKKLEDVFINKCSLLLIMRQP